MEDLRCSLTFKILGLCDAQRLLLCCQYIVTQRTFGNLIVFVLPTTSTVSITRTLRRRYCISYKNLIALGFLSTQVHNTRIYDGTTDISRITQISVTQHQTPYHSCHTVDGQTKTPDSRPPIPATLLGPTPNVIYFLPLGRIR